MIPLHRIQRVREFHHKLGSPAQFDPQSPRHIHSYQNHVFDGMLSSRLLKPDIGKRAKYEQGNFVNCRSMTAPSPDPILELVLCFIFLKDIGYNQGFSGEGLEPKNPPSKVHSCTESHRDILTSQEK